MKHGEVLDSTECDMPCAGTVSGEYCGGWDKITAYKIKKYVFPQYIGCYADAPARAMDAEGMHVTGAMTNEVSVRRNTRCLPCSRRLSCVLLLQSNQRRTVASSFHRHTRGFLFTCVPPAAPDNNSWWILINPLMYIILLRRCAYRTARAKGTPMPGPNTPKR